MFTLAVMLGVVHEEGIKYRLSRGSKSVYTWAQAKRSFIWIVVILYEDGRLQDGARGGEECRVHAHQLTRITCSLRRLRWLHPQTTMSWQRQQHPTHQPSEQLEHRIPPRATLNPLDSYEHTIRHYNFTSYPSSSKAIRPIPLRNL